MFCGRIPVQYAARIAPFQSSDRAALTSRATCSGENVAFSTLFTFNLSTATNGLNLDAHKKMAKLRRLHFSRKMRS